jgi:hypothetical protein
MDIYYKLPPNPSLLDLQRLWESQYHGKRSWLIMCKTYERWMKFFGPDRQPRDIFRSDIAAYKIWLSAKGWKDGSVTVEMERLRRFYRVLDERELIEAGFNPATGMSPRRIRLR